jgi:hypothetical protein|tara:strand:- start:379 stop:1158 length:780 start_codon:yes stop_codon:yes gene_type:complete
MEHENQTYVQKALEFIKTEGILEKLQEHGEPLFLMLSGAHNFGFPSKDSDMDIRGVYFAPTTNFLDLDSKQKKVFEYMSDDRNLDVSVDELRHYLQLVSNSNGNRIEWPFSELIIYQSQDFENLKKTIQESAICKKTFDHYLHFARDMWDGKTKEEGVKKDLYALRVYMTGITLLEEEIICSDIKRLNQRFGEEIEPMLKTKYDCEKNLSQGYDRRKLSQVIQSLDDRIILAHQNSNLPDYPDTEKINEYHRNFRIDKL